MHSDLLSCCICCFAYDRALHLPKLIPTCGHTICSKCLATILSTQNPPKCPLDRSILPNAYRRNEDFPTNLLPLQLLDEKLKVEFDTCHLHQEIKSFICMTDQISVCKSCIETTKHKNHNIKHIDIVKTEANVKKKQLESLLADFDGHQKAIQNLLKEENNSFVIVIKEKFETLRNLLRQKEQEILEEIAALFFIEEADVERSLESDFLLQKRTQVKISDLVRPMVDERVIKTLAGPIKQFNVRQKHDELVTNFKKIKQQFQSEFDNLEKSLASSLKNVQNIFSFTAKEEKPNNMDIERSQSLNNFGISNLLNYNKGAELALAIITEENYESQGFWPNKYQSQKENKVILSFGQSPIIEKGIQEIGLICNNLEDISVLTMNLYGSKTIEKEISILCSDTFWAKQKTHSFYLNLLGSCKFEEPVIQLLATALLKMSNLKRLSIRLNDKIFSDDTCQGFITRVCPLLVNFEHFSLDLSGTTISDASAKRLFLKLKQDLKKVQTIELFLDNTQVTDTSVSLFCKDLFKNMYALENLRLCLNETKVTDISLIQLCSGQKDIKKLALDLSFTYITDKSLTNFCDNLIPASSFESLELLLEETDVTDDGVTQLYSSLKNKVDNILIFNMNLQGTEISDKSVIALCSYALPYMRKLKSFKLYLGSKDVTDESGKILCHKLIGILSNIEVFYLSLAETSVTAKSVQVLISYIDVEAMKALRSFDINLNEEEDEEDDDNIVAYNRLCDFLRSIHSKLYLRRNQKVNICIS